MLETCDILVCTFSLISLALIIFILCIVIVKPGEPLVIYNGIASIFFLVALLVPIAFARLKQIYCAGLIQAILKFYFWISFHTSILLVYLKKLSIGVLSDSVETNLRQMAQFIGRKEIFLAVLIPLFLIFPAVIAFVLGAQDYSSTSLPNTWSAGYYESKSTMFYFYRKILYSIFLVLNIGIMMFWARSWYLKRKTMKMKYSASQNEYFQSYKNAKYIIVKIFVNAFVYLVFSLTQNEYLFDASVNAIANSLIGILFLFLFGTSKFILRAVSEIIRRHSSVSSSTCLDRRSSSIGISGRRGTVLYMSNASVKSDKEIVVGDFESNQRRKSFEMPYSSQISSF